MKTQRVTVTLPPEVVRDIDRLETNRSRFVLQAVEQEIQTRRQAALRLSIANPHEEIPQLADEGLGEWLGQGAGDAEDLLDASEGQPIQWAPDSGWSESST